MWRPGTGGARTVPCRRHAGRSACWCATHATLHVRSRRSSESISTTPSTRWAANPETGPGQPVQCLTAQPWGSWSEHVRSWLAPEVPFPVHLVRYEDLRADAVATLEPVFEAIGLRCTREQLDSRSRTGAVRSPPRVRSPDRLSRGARENAGLLPRRAAAGGWREELSDAQVAAIEADHGDVDDRTRLRTRDRRSDTPGPRRITVVASPSRSTPRG